MTAYDVREIIPLGEDGEAYLHPGHLGTNDVVQLIRGINDFYWTPETIAELGDWTVYHGWCLIQENPEFSDKDSPYYDFEEYQFVYRFADGAESAFTVVLRNGMFSVPDCWIVP